MARSYGASCAGSDRKDRGGNCLGDPQWRSHPPRLGGLTPNHPDITTPPSGSTGMRSTLKIDDKITEAAKSLAGERNVLEGAIPSEPALGEFALQFQVDAKVPEAGVA